jgi:L-alanine-DL-glutamate epimerase-like enolase superfamily enzyme
MTPQLHRIDGVKVFFLLVKTRLPLKFGTETLHSVTCCRVALRVVDEQNQSAEGWGETPLSVQWVWPSGLSYERRHQSLQAFCRKLAEAWGTAPIAGHPLEAGHHFEQHVLTRCFADFNRRLSVESPSGAGPHEPMPWLAALVCNSPFDLALHDAFGRLVSRPIYETYNATYLKADLSHFLEPAKSEVSFVGRYPSDFLSPKPPMKLPAWHLVGGLDPLEPEDLLVPPPQDGYPVLLRDWIAADGLRCLKIKLRGTDEEWDYQRLCRIGKLALPLGVEWLTADFNCTVQKLEYVLGVLARLEHDFPDIYRRLLFVEQPFAYDLETQRLDVRKLAARKPLFLDESAHDWRMVRLGLELGWNGVALKTCKTQTGAILSACWARAHGMDLMVQDLTNPMLAQIPHVQLAGHVGTIMGVETNAMQFYPQASEPESQVHPGLYQRREGMVDLSSIRGPGFGYRLEEIHRDLPSPAYIL